MGGAQRRSVAQSLKKQLRAAHVIGVRLPSVRLPVLLWGISV